MRNLVMLGILLGLGGCGDGQPVSENTATTDVHPAATPAYVHELPLKTARAMGARAPKLSRDAEQMRRLWRELEGFKRDPKFHVLGFDNPFEYGEWRGKVRSLNDRAGKKLVGEIGSPPAELEVLGDEYRKNNGMRSERADTILAKLDAALNSKAAAVGQMRVARETQGCADFSKLAQSLRELEEGDGQASNASLDAAACVSIPSGSIVSAPAKRMAYDWLKDSGQRVYVLVRSPQGELWLPEEDLSR